LKFVSIDLYKFQSRGRRQFAGQSWKPWFEESGRHHNRGSGKIDPGEGVVDAEDWGIVRYFSRNEKQKLSIEIGFRDSIESLWMSVRVNRGHKYRPASRKNGVPITMERFKQFLYLTTQFLFSPNSCLVNIENYVKKFYTLLKGEDKIAVALIGTEAPFDRVLIQLSLRREEIEKRLIEHDSDTPVDRAKLRGELEGLQYAVAAINGIPKNK